jgi:hypothetical protein
MSFDDELHQVLSEFEGAVIAASGRLGELGLRVDQVEVDLKTVIEREASGELDLKVIKLGGGVGSEHGRTISVIFEPSASAPAASVNSELLDALELIERAVATASNYFALSSAMVELAFGTNADGRISVVVGGSARRTETHTARLRLAPE